MYVIIARPGVIGGNVVPPTRMIVVKLSFFGAAATAATRPVFMQFFSSLY